MLDSYKMVDYYPAFVKPTRYVDGFRQSAPKADTALPSRRAEVFSSQAIRLWSCPPTRRHRNCIVVWIGYPVNNLWQDFRFAGRVLAKSPGATAVAVLAIGVLAAAHLIRSRSVE
jgi:hypothetical protein